MRSRARRRGAWTRAGSWPTHPAAFTRSRNSSARCPGGRSRSRTWCIPTAWPASRCSWSRIRPRCARAKRRPRRAPRPSSCGPWATRWSRCSGKSPLPPPSGSAAASRDDNFGQTGIFFRSAPSQGKRPPGRGISKKQGYIHMNRLQASFLGAVLALGLAQAQAQPQAAPQGPKQNMGPVPAQVLPDFADLVEKYGPAVVNINTQTRAPRQQVPGLSEDDPFFEFFRRFMPPDQQPPGRGGPRGQQREPNAPNMPRGPLRPFGLGSGFIVSPDGYIVTNAHVVENAEEINVRLSDKREFKAKLIGADTRSDVAVVKVEAKSLPTMKIGDTSKLRPGEWVI